MTVWRLGQVTGIGLATGVGFVLPILAMRFVPPGQERIVGLLAAVAAAILLIRRLGRVLHRLLDSTERGLRFPLLAVYAVMAMVPLAGLLLLPAPVVVASSSTASAASVRNGT